LKLRINKGAIAALPEAQRLEAEKAIEAIAYARENNPLAFYKPHVKQRAFHGFTTQTKIFYGGNQSGKTTTSLADSIIQAIDRDAVPAHLLPYKKFEPPFLCRIMAESFPVLETTLLQKLQELVPKDQLLGGSWGSTEGSPGAYDKNLRVLHFANESKFFFQTYEQEVRKMGGASIDRVVFDEEPPLAVFNECRLRVMARSGDLLFSMTPLFGLSWTFDQQWQKRGSEVANDVFVSEDMSIVTASMEDNPTLGAKEIELALAGMSDEEKVARKEGRHVALHGLIYADFKKERHVTPQRPIPENINVVVGIDPGMRHPAGVVWIYLTADDTMVVFEAQRFTGMTAAQVSKRILEINEAYGVHPLYYVIDPNARNKEHQTGRSVQMEYADNGIVTIAGQNAVTAGINRVRERFQKDTLFVQSNCAEMIDELQKYRWKAPPRSGEATREAPVKLADDLVDPLRYCIMSRPYLPNEVVEDNRDPMLKLMQEDIERSAGEMSEATNIGQFGGVAA
jgi:phage terminase large subunit-like protein